MQIKVYKPVGSQKTWVEEWRKMVLDLMSSQDLASRLTIRDFKAQYRQSILGALWAFITPLMNTLIWVFLQQSGVVKVSDTGIPFAAYVFSGTMLWSILTESINAPLISTQQSKSIMGKINFPKEALLLSGLYKAASNALIRIVLILIMLLVFGVYPSYSILLMPLFVLGLIVFGFSVGLLLTPIGMLYSDIGRAIPLILQFLMYATPVVYAIPPSGILSTLIHINPVTPLLVNARNAFTNMPMDQITYYVCIQAISMVAIIVGWFFYRFSIPIIVERSSS